MKSMAWLLKHPADASRRLKGSLVEVQEAYFTRLRPRQVNWEDGEDDSGDDSGDDSEDDGAQPTLDPSESGPSGEGSTAPPTGPAGLPTSLSPPPPPAAPSTTPLPSSTPNSTSPPPPPPPTPLSPLTSSTLPAPPSPPTMPSRTTTSATSYTPQAITQSTTAITKATTAPMSSPTSVGPSQPSSAFSVTLVFASATTAVQTQTSLQTTIQRSTIIAASSISTTSASQRGVTTAPSPIGVPVSNTISSGTIGASSATMEYLSTVATTPNPTSPAPAPSTAPPTEAAMSATPIPSSTLNRQTAIGIGVGIGIWSLITITAFVTWLLRRRKRKQRERAAASRVFSEYDPQQIYFGEGGGVERSQMRKIDERGREVVETRTLERTIVEPRRPATAWSRVGAALSPLIEEVRSARPWSWRSADTRTEMQLAPGLRSHPIATRNTMEDLAGFRFPSPAAIRVPPSPVSSLASGDSRITALHGAYNNNHMSIESLTGPDFPFRTRSPSPNEEVARLRLTGTENSSVRELPSQPRVLPPALTKLQGWLEENRRRSRPGYMMSRWSETEESRSGPSRPTTIARSSRGAGVRSTTPLGNSSTTL